MSLPFLEFPPPFTAKPSLKRRDALNRWARPRWPTRRSWRPTAGKPYGSSGTVRPLGRICLDRAADFSVKRPHRRHVHTGRPLSRQFGWDPTEWAVVVWWICQRPACNASIRLPASARCRCPLVSCTTHRAMPGRAHAPCWSNLPCVPTSLSRGATGHGNRPSNTGDPQPYSPRDSIAATVEWLPR